MKRKRIFVLKRKNIIILFLIYIIIIIKFPKEFILKKGHKVNELFNDENYQNIKDSFNKAKDFLDKCQRGIIIKNRTIFSPKNLIASAIIPIFNSEKTIKRATISIQNQNIENLEIILVNDFSNDNTSSVIEDLKKEDNRIKIINNQKRMGTLYSRCIGVLLSKGEHIFHLDSDDMFLDKDIFLTMINIILLGNFDFISFNVIITYKIKNILNSKIKEFKFANNNFNRILFKPELELYPLKPGNKLGNYIVKDNFLWNKCIKAKLYKKVLKKIKENKFSRFMIYEEDRLIIYVLYNFAESMKFVKKYGILKIRNEGSITRKSYMKSKEYFLSILYFADIIIDLSKKSLPNRKVLVYIMSYLLYLLNFNCFDKLNAYDKKIFISCLNRIISNKYVSFEDKEKLVVWTLSLIFKSN